MPRERVGGAGAVARVSVETVPGVEPFPREAVAVIVDVLRATSTLTAALENGAAGVLPAASPEEAFALKRSHPAALVCGERDGRKVPGFDLGNSPFEYGSGTVAGRTLIFASTNGSAAMRRARGARRRILAAFVNAAAVAASLATERRIVIVCAGKLGRFSLEDASFAGWLCARLAEGGAEIAGAAARLALALAPRDAAQVMTLVQGSSHGRYLRTLGSLYAADVEYCGRIDTIGRAFELGDEPSVAGPGRAR
jgi:2-phosphosulfolactate phosphatase